MNEMVLEVIESVNDYIEKVQIGSVRIAEMLRNDEIQEALQSILNFSEGMGWLVDASNLLKQNDIDVSLEVEQIHEFLHEINTGLEIQDYVLVADMFEYEIAPFFENVERIQGFMN